MCVAAHGQKKAWNLQPCGVVQCVQVARNGSFSWEISHSHCWTSRIYTSGGDLWELSRKLHGEVWHKEH